MPSRDIKTLKYLPPVGVLKTVSVSPLHNTICTRKLEHVHSLNHTMTHVFHFVERKSDKSLDCFQSTFTLMNKVCHLEQLSTPHPSPYGEPRYWKSLLQPAYYAHFVQGDIGGTENTGATIFQTITVSLTSNTTAIQSVHKILRQMMVMYPQTRFGCKRISSSEDTLEMIIF